MKKLFIFLLLSVSPFVLFAQNDLMDLLNKDTIPEINFVSATFKSTRVMNGHSIERMPSGQLDFRVLHRFGTLNSGANLFFGLDVGYQHLSLEYGILDWLMVGIGRSSYERTFNGFAKFTLFRQSSGARVMPVSISLMTSVAHNHAYTPNYFSSPFSYVGQILIARKINQVFSLQIAPSIVHRSLVATVTDPNDLYAIGAGGRIKLIKRISFNAEYYYVANSKNYINQHAYDPLSLGFDIETGGHVFQLIFTNSLMMIEKGFLGETTGDWRKGDILFGFNISRVFTLKKHSRATGGN